MKEFVIILLGQVSYSTHHLPVGYLGSAVKDLETLQRIETLLPGILSDDDRTAYAAEVVEETAAIREFLQKHH